MCFGYDFLLGLRIWVLGGELGRLWGFEELVCILVLVGDFGLMGSVGFFVVFSLFIFCWFGCLGYWLVWSFYIF